MMEIEKSIELAKQQFQSGQLKLAEELSSRILQSDADQPEALHLLGLINHNTGKSDIAVELITKAIAIDSQIPEFHYNLGTIFCVLDKTADAIRSYRAALYLKPDYPDALNNLGLILFDQDRLEESKILFQQSIRVKPDSTNAYYNLGMVLQAQGRPEEAIDAYNHVLKIIPDSAETRFNRSLSLLLIGNFKEGWDEYEWRFKKLNDPIKNQDKKSIQRWDGSSFAGKRLLVMDEQGIGDTLQFIRYLPMVKELGGIVIFETILPLITLLSHFEGIDELWDRSAVERSKLEFDLFIPLMSLPGIFNTTLETIPAKVPYILPDASKVRYWQRRFKKDTVNVGIVWAGKTSTDYRKNRKSGLAHVNLEWAGQPASNFASHRLTRLDPFLPPSKIEGIQFYGLQKGDAAVQARELSGIFDVDNLGEEFGDFSDTAAAIENLDLVISVDTSVAHLAGAMGKPVWVLIPFVSDWRWLLERESSPWYPTMRLFRQRKRGDWEDVFQRICDELNALVRQ